jgi:hypothetical protein
MLAATHYLRQGRLAIFLSSTLFFGSCDDDEHKFTQIVSDDLESGNKWTFHNVAPAVHEDLLDGAVSASASHSLAIKSAKAEASGFSFWSLRWAPEDILVGSSLELHVNVKVTDVTGEGAFVAMRGDAGSAVVFFETTQGSKSITGNRDFETYTVKLDSYPEGVSEMFIFLIMHGSSSGTVNFDDISLVSHH